MCDAISNYFSGTRLPKLATLLITLSCRKDDEIQCTEKCVYVQRLYVVAIFLCFHELCDDVDSWKTLRGKPTDGRKAADASSPSSSSQLHIVMHKGMLSEIPILGMVLFCPIFGLQRAIRFAVRPCVTNGSSA